MRMGEIYLIIISEFRTILRIDIRSGSGFGHLVSFKQPTSSMGFHYSKDTLDRTYPADERSIDSVPRIDRACHKAQAAYNGRPPKSNRLRGTVHNH